MIMTNNWKKELIASVMILGGLNYIRSTTKEVGEDG